MERQRLRKGDAFDVALPDGRHGAAVVLEDFGRSVAFGVTDYIGEATAKGDELELRRVLRMKGGALEGEPVVRYCEPVWPTSKYIGRIDLVDAVELSRDVRATGPWSHRDGYVVYWEWLRVTDPVRRREEYRAFRQAEERERARKKRALGPGRLLGDGSFWRIIGSGEKWVADADRAEADCIARLAKCSVNQIALFEKTLTYKLFLLDTRAHAEAFADGGELSPDLFLYGRCGVVASGPEFYETVLEDPAWFPPEADAEGLLYVATKAYEKVTGEALEPDVSYSYETGSNEEGWV